ncbi:hypothetical protein EST38_g4011 [Candolleomyces aberdarensis]|uniref:Uncharacterized protein n=1 Tax=Candolleomyces aberdarensis TaxID=2316362 RepID=A0A4Q2DSF6_9AGAR|nr:hypothetical protein EST38_g4011 [Candolleomyces aberdarensis]
MLLSDGVDSSNPTPEAGSGGLDKVTTRSSASIIVPSQSKVNSGSQNATVESVLTMMHMLST